MAAERSSNDVALNPLVQKTCPAACRALSSSYCRGLPRARFTLGEKGLSRGREEKFDSVTPTAAKGEPGRWVSRIVSLVKKDHMTQAYAEIHPNMVVPALVHDGNLYLESMDIIEYLDDAFDGTPLIPATASDNAPAIQADQRGFAYVILNGTVVVNEFPVAPTVGRISLPGDAAQTRGCR